MNRSLDRYDRQRLDPGLTTGLILCGMGGPDGPHAVEPFLRNLFADPEILPMPRLVARFVGRRIASRRAPKVARDYARITRDSVTPQLAITRRQATRLATALSAGGRPTLPGIAMRYWDPYPEQTAAELMGSGAQQFLLVPMYPQFSWATNGSTLDFVLAGLQRVAPEAPVHVVPDWHLLPGYIEALARPVIRNLSIWARADVDPRQAGLFYVAHSLPESFVKKGDPYLARTRETVHAVHEVVSRVLQAAEFGPWLDVLLAGGREPKLVFQSKVGPVKWVGPEIAEETPRLAREGLRSLFVQPVSFTCEHIETLLELGIDLKDTAHAAGIVDFRRGPALNLNRVWLDDLATHLVQDAFLPEVGRLVVDN